MITSKASPLYIDNNEDKLEYTVEYMYTVIARRYLNSDYLNVLQLTPSILELLLITGHINRG